MKPNHFNGKLIAFDGPNGVGKTTLIKKVYDALSKNGISTYTTKEPTSSALGIFAKEIAKTLSGDALACLVAADRYDHMMNDIIPYLRNGYVVLLDRYVLSSLILQRMDQVDVDFILAVNQNILAPDLQVAVEASVAVIEERLMRRNPETLTRWEQGRTEEEISFLREGASILKDFGISTLMIDNTENLENNVTTIINVINKV